ncbi:MAG TPA: DUF4062 domain-containing protein [Thermoanaerobaculia bacterium]|nr:DUF4062 domain-containing protein [Thermoanaerobaculia bacterium]
MTNDKRSEPVAYKGVMVSSTFTDLVQHREALIKAIDKQKLKAVAMENDSALPAIDLIDSSLQMVRDAAAYIGVISHKYGQIPECPKRNPKGLSVTELEFNEARRLGRPVLLFIMGDGHDVKKGDVEIEPDKITKLAAFRENAKLMKSDSAVHRVYKVFNSLHEFEVVAMQSVAELRRYLDQPAESTAERREVANTGESDPIPMPPAFYAEPPYIGSHKFVGREAQLETLSDWAAAADPHPVLLFEAIGGAGKSMLTWEWTTQHAMAVRDDWAGRFWYSFYEKGAVMADFCQRALAYITERPLEAFRKKKTLELSELLLHQLRARRWLIVLDGLERVLVAYHRFDAARLADEEAGTTDKIAQRDPCAAIRPEDDDLLRALASAAPSKLLLTSRLVPRVLLNSANQPISGVLHERLPGLRPADAEALLRSCGITGTSQDIQNYLKSHCDCHPLVTGVLAGLINDYLADRGNFDSWSADRDGGAALNLNDLNLVQKRNHILRAALDALPPKGRQLLSTLALLSEAVDYATLSAFNPHLPPEPDEVDVPGKPQDSWRWEGMSDDEKAQAQRAYQTDLQRRAEYEQAIAARHQSAAFIAAPHELKKTVLDMERRGLLQYDAQVKRYDLHPVVRGIAAGGLRQEERERYGQRVVDHFTQLGHSPYDEAETIDDLRDGLHVTRTLLQMSRIQEAFYTYWGDLSNALFFNLEAFPSVLSLLRPFFPDGWGALPSGLLESDAAKLTNDAAYALDEIGETEEAIAAYAVSIQAGVRQKNFSALASRVFNVSYPLLAQNRIAAEGRCILIAFELATLLDDQEDLFMARLYRFRQLTRIGLWSDAKEMWILLDSMGRHWTRTRYRPGFAELEFARFLFARGKLSEGPLNQAEVLAKAGRNRAAIRLLERLRGTWQLEQCQWEPAAASLNEAVRMAHDVEQIDEIAETQLALANFQLGRLAIPGQEAEQLSRARNPAHGDLAALWLAIGDSDQAKNHALAAYKWAWADGEPFVHRYELNKARGLLEQLDVEIPDLPHYDPAKDEKLSWEDDVAAAIERLRTEKSNEGLEAEP